METSIWYKLSPPNTPPQILTDPQATGMGCTSLGHWLKNNGVPQIGQKVPYNLENKATLY